MSSGYRVLDEIAVADIAFEAVGDSPSELCAAAAEAIIDILADPTTVAPTWRRIVDLEAEALADLLFDWLSEMVYLKDAEAVVFCRATASVNHDTLSRCWRLHGELVGEAIDPARQALRADVKAVTKHLYDVQECGGRWTARVVLDI